MIDIYLFLKEEQIVTPYLNQRANWILAWTLSKQRSSSWSCFAPGSTPFFPRHRKTATATGL